MKGASEALAGILRPGNAGSNTAADHVEVLDAALAQLPVRTTVEDPDAGVEIIARADSTALTHGFVDACAERGVRFAIGHDLTEKMAKVLVSVPTRRWRPAISADGSDERPGAEVAEITDLIDLSGWPTGTRAIARREDPHPGAQLTFTDVDGHRFQVFVTDLEDPDVAYLEALPPAHPGAHRPRATPHQTQTRRHLALGAPTRRRVHTSPALAADLSARADQQPSGSPIASTRARTTTGSLDQRKPARRFVPRSQPTPPPSAQPPPTPSRPFSGPD